MLEQAICRYCEAQARIQQLQAQNAELHNTAAAMIAEHSARRADLEAARKADGDRIRQLEDTVCHLAERLVTQDHRLDALGAAQHAQVDLHGLGKGLTGAVHRLYCGVHGGADAAAAAIAAILKTMKPHLYSSTSSCCDILRSPLCMMQLHHISCTCNCEHLSGDSSRRRPLSGNVHSAAVTGPRQKACACPLADTKARKSCVRQLS